MQTLIFDRFLVDFCTQLRPPEPSKSLFFLRKNNVFFQKIAFRSWHRFLIDFGLNLPPFWKQKSIKNRSKIDPKRHPKNDPNFDGFLDHLGSILGAKLEPCWPLFPPKTPQDAPKTPQDAQPERGTVPPGAALGIDHFWDASWDRFFGRFASILAQKKPP